MSDTDLLQFPVEFPIKVMGRHDSTLLADSLAIVERHAGTLSPERVRQRRSSDGNFLAVTFLIVADTQAQLDAIYIELSACKSVLMAL